LLPISTSIFKNYFLKFSDLKYKSDNNLFFASYEETKSYKLNEITENVDLRGDNTLFKGTFNQITLIMADETKIITRIYDKISYSFAQIGGLAQLFILLSKIILYFWSKNNILIYLISTILPNEEKNKVLTKANNNSELENIVRPKSFLFGKKSGKAFKKIIEENNANINNNNNKDILNNSKNNLNKEGSIIDNKNFKSNNKPPASSFNNSLQSSTSNAQDNFLPKINNFIEEKNKENKPQKNEIISNMIAENNMYLIIKYNKSLFFLLKFF
jgi:hypothetical protein